MLRSADEWRAKINPPLRTDFHRVPGQFELSADKCRLDFTIRDEQFPGENYPPKYVTEVEASHSLATAQAGRLFEWIGRLSATYTCAKGEDLSVLEAVNAFGKLAQDRLSQWFARRQADVIRNAGDAILRGILGGAAAAKPPAPGVGIADAVLFGLNPAGALGGLLGGALGGGAQGGGPAVGALAGRPAATPIIVPVSFYCGEPALYDSLRVQLEMTYRVAGATLAEILQLGGLYTPVPGPDWETWAISLKDVLGPGGHARMVLFTSGEEQLVDLCARVPPDFKDKSRNRQNVPKKPKKPTRWRVENLEQLFPKPLYEVFPVPPKPKSLLSYSTTISIDEDSGTVVGVTLPEVPIGSSSGSSSRDKFGEVFVQRRVRPVTYLVLSGYAFRAGYPIAVPALTKVDKQDLVPCNRVDTGEGFHQSIVGQGGLDGELPIYGATWKLRYALPT